MAQDYNYNMATPGTAVSGQLQDILARKKAEERQRMIDQVSLQAQQAQMATQAENVASLKAQREASVAKSKFDIDSQTQARAARQNFLKSPEYAAMSPEDRAIMGMAAAGSDDDLFKAMIMRAPEVGMNSIDDATGEVSAIIDPVTHRQVRARTSTPVLHRPRAPQGPQASYSYAGTDGQGNPVTLNSRTGAFSSSGPLRAKPTSGGANRPIIPAGMSQKAAQLRAKAVPTPGQFFGTNQPLPANVTAYDEFVTNMLSQANVSDPSVVDSVRQIIADDDPRSTAEILAQYQGQEGMTPQEFNELTQLLYATRGE